MNRPEFFEAVAVLEAGCRKKLFANQQQLEVWYALLRHFSRDEIMLAVQRFLAEDADGWVTIGKLCGYAAEYAYETLPTAGEAWAEVRRVLKQFSPYRDPAETLAQRATLHPLVRAAADAAGWDVIASGENAGVQEGLFRKRYADIRDRDECLRRLPERIRPRLGRGQEGPVPRPVKFLAASLPAIDDEPESPRTISHQREAFTR